MRLDRASALHLLRDLARDRGVLADLRRLWAREAAQTTLCFASDEQVLRQLAGLVASGALVIARVRAPVHASVHAFPPMADEGAGETKGEEPKEPAWVEFVLLVVQQDGSRDPFDGAAYEIVLEDRSVVKGKLPGNGKIRLDGIEGDTCTVTFPEIFAEDWEIAG